MSNDFIRFFHAIINIFYSNTIFLHALGEEERGSLLVKIAVFILLLLRIETSLKRERQIDLCNMCNTTTQLVRIDATFLNFYTLFRRKMDYAMLPGAESLTIREHAGDKRALCIRAIRRNYCAKGQRERARFLPLGICSALYEQKKLLANFINPPIREQ